MPRFDPTLLIYNVVENRQATPEEINEHVRIVCVNETNGKIELELYDGYHTITDFQPQKWFPQGGS